MKEEITEKIGFDKNISVKLEGGLMAVHGPKGEVQRRFVYPKINIAVEQDKVILSSPKCTKREKKIICSFASHIKNMFKGVQTPFVYKLRVCSGHFPMNVSVSGKELVIKNFLGENVPRKVGLLPNVDVKVDGKDIIVASVDKEAAGQTAARIERLCKITNRDLRIFQDGCYLIHKGGKDL